MMAASAWEFTMPGLQIEQFLCGADNYGVLIHDASSGETAAIDTPELAPIQARLREKGRRLTHILTTHHHGDHVAGHEALRAETRCEIYGGARDRGRIPGMTRALGEGDIVRLGSHEARVIETPGHTLGHICYWFEKDGLLFAGDTLFSLGCGRLLEGGPEDMWRSLAKLSQLPPETLVYCGHEYTAGNAAFALTVEPGNAALKARAEEVRALRAASAPCVPSRLGDELAANPFLRPHSEEIQTRIGMKGHPPAAIFAELRRRKDSFR
jgi:hydroxyacylglutathione hydrolase